MRFLILSDIHSNRFGLEAALQDAAGKYDRVLCLGDIVGYGAHPNECCQVMQDLGAQCLLGNHDAAALGSIGIEWFNPVAAVAALWTRDQLTPENTTWLKSLQPQNAWSQYSYQAVHGSLREPLEEYILSDDIAEPTLALMQQPVCFFGHTHKAVAFSQSRERRPWPLPNNLQTEWLPQGGRIKLEEGRKYLVNPGSCGQPRDGNPQARYGLFDIETGTVEVKACDYDVHAAREAIRDAGLPTILGDRLLRGR